MQGSQAAWRTKPSSHHTLLGVIVPGHMNAYEEGAAQESHVGDEVFGITSRAESAPSHRRAIQRARPSSSKAESSIPLSLLVMFEGSKGSASL